MYAINVQIYPNNKTKCTTLPVIVLSFTVPTVYANMLIIKIIHAITFNTIILSVLFYFLKFFQTRSFIKQIYKSMFSITALASNTAI